MPPYLISWARLLWVLMAAVLCGGCVGDYRSEFRGTITRGLMTTNAPSVHSIGSYFGRLDPKQTDALMGFGMPEGSIFFIHDRQKYFDRDYRLSNDAVKAVYFSDEGCQIHEDIFVSESRAKRDSTEGIHHLEGSFQVERWKSDMDFRIRLAMHSTEPNPVAVNGVLISYTHWEFNPLRGVGLILGSMGLVGE